jgi:hypothetical protein
MACLVFPATRGTMADHFDGCSPSIGLGAVPGNTRMNELTPFHAGDPWGVHIVPSKHCKHPIQTILGAACVIVDDRPLAVTHFPVLSCGVPITPTAPDILINVV